MQPSTHHQETQLGSNKIVHNSQKMNTHLSHDNNSDNGNKKRGGKCCPNMLFYPVPRHTINCSLFDQSDTLCMLTLTDQKSICVHKYLYVKLSILTLAEQQLCEYTLRVKPSSRPSFGLPGGTSKWLDLFSPRKQVDSLTQEHTKVWLKISKTTWPEYISLDEGCALITN